ncbi:MAG: glutamyl-tRNA reductase [Firmicutes bacterium]|nr:glutamyl-tRNA reductase [Bacillota bacterium]
MDLVLVGLSHHRVPVEVREKFSVPAGEMEPELRRLLEAAPELRSAVILSTCNRVEVYALATRVHAGFRVLISYLSRRSGLDYSSFRTHLTLLSNARAVEHLLRVVSGLDSLVLGEDEILGQVRAAYMAAGRAGATDAVLNGLFQRALSLGKRVRTLTGINNGRASIPGAAVALARSVTGGGGRDLADRTVLVVGAGAMGRLAAGLMRDRGAGRILVANRNLKRAEELAGELGGTPVSWDSLREALSEADIVICCTNAQGYVVTGDMLRSVAGERRSPLCLIDIAVPRDVERDVEAELDPNGKCQIRLFDIDDLHRVVEDSNRERLAEAEKAEALVEAETEAFVKWWREREVAPYLKALRERAEELRLRTTGRFERDLAALSPREQAKIEQFTRSLMKGFIRGPLEALKELASAGGEYPAGLEMVSRLFELDKDMGTDTSPDTYPGQDPDTYPGQDPGTGSGAGSSTVTGPGTGLDTNTGPADSGMVRDADEGGERDAP